MNLVEGLNFVNTQFKGFFSESWRTGTNPALLATLHTVANCPKTWGGSANRRVMRCSYCGRKDHNIEACPKTFEGNAARAWHEETVADHFVRDR